MSTATYKEFGNDKHHDPRTAGNTLNAIGELCAQFDPDDFSPFLKAAKSYGLNGVHEPFWRYWPLSDPDKFLKVEPLHHFFRMGWDHDIQWCIMVVGEDEIDYRFNLLQTLVGYRSFADGISKLKQVTGRDHRSIQQYILCTVAGAAPPRFLAAVHALLDFHYLAQMPVFDEQALTKLDAAGNNQNYYAQIARYLDRSDRCFRFNLATGIASSPDSRSDINDDPADEDHEPDDEKSHTLLYHSPTRKIMNYFQIAHALANGPSCNTPKCTFASCSSAIHLATKPHRRMTIDEAAALFDLPDLRLAICEYFYRCANGVEHNIAGRRRASPNCSLPSDRIQIWTKVCVQVRNYHNPGLVEPAQTMNVAPPSQEHPRGLYDSAVFSPSAESDWPSQGLNGK